MGVAALAMGEAGIDTITMLKRVLLIGGSLIVAAGLLVLAWQVETPSPAPSDSGSANGSRTTSLHDDAASGQGDGSTGSGGDEEGGRMLRVTDKRRTLLTYADIDPRPQGVFDVTQPDARVFFSPRRVMTIEADRGTIVAPGNRPREGRFQGRVVVTLYRTDADRAVSLKGTRDIAFRVYLDDAEFDLELGRLHSSGPVHLTGRNVDFRGRTLLLRFNELDNRLQLLKVRHGRVLRFRRAVAGDAEPLRGSDAAGASEGGDEAGAEAKSDAAAGASSNSDGAATSDAATGSSEAGETGGGDNRATSHTADEPNQSPATGPDSQGGEKPTPPPFYRVRFRDQVRVEASGRDLHARSDSLEAIFAFQGRSPLGTGEGESASKTSDGTANAGEQTAPRPLVDHERSPRLALDTIAGTGAAALGAAISRVQSTPTPTQPGGPSTTQPMAVAATQPATRAATRPATQPATQPRRLTFDEPLMPLAAAEVVVRWSGPMVIEPEPAPPGDLAGPEDVLLRFRGTPVRVRSGQRGTMRAAELTYLSSNGRVTAVGNRTSPLVLNQPGVGRLSGQRLRLNPTTHTGTVLGPGLLRHDAKAAGTEQQQQRGMTASSHAATQPDVERATPAKKQQALAIHWQNRLDLTFTPEGPKARKTGDMADEKNVSRSSLASPTPQNNAQAADRSAAAGDSAEANDSTAEQGGKLSRLGRLQTAMFTGTVRAEHPRFRLSSRQLTVPFQPTRDGEVRPGAIDATGDAELHARQTPQQRPATLWASELHIDLAGRPGGGIQPTGLRARRDVRLKRQGLDLTARRLRARLGDASPVPSATKQMNSDPESLWRPPFTKPLLATADEQGVPQAHTRPATQPDGESSDDERFAVAAMLKQFVAEEQVRVTVADPRLELTGRRLTLRPNPDRLELWGSDARPARLRQPKGRLEGRRIRINRATDTVRVPVPGRFVFDAERKQPDNARSRLTATWRQAMRYDHQTGRAHMQGNVRAETASPSERTTLTCRDLTLRFARAADQSEPATQPSRLEGPTAGAAGGTSYTSGTEVTAVQLAAPHSAAALLSATEPATTRPAGDATTRPDDSFAADRRLTRLIARGEALFTAESRATTEAGLPHTRLRLEGPTIRFARRKEKVEVPGPGRMLIEDRRPRKSAATQPAGDMQGSGNEPDNTGQSSDGSNDVTDETGETTDPAVDFAGRGQTLFTWDGLLTLDAAKSDMVMTRDVWMIHKPLGQGRSLTLDCERLLADLSNAGGMGMWLSREAPDTQLNQVRAERNVRVQRAGRTIRAGHLKYTAGERSVRFRAEADELVTVSSEEKPTPFRAERLQWHLDDNRFEATGVRGGSVPVPRQR